MHQGTLSIDTSIYETLFRISRLSTFLGFIIGVYFDCLLFL